MDLLIILADYVRGAHDCELRRGARVTGGVQRVRRREAVMSGFGGMGGIGGMGGVGNSMQNQEQAQLMQIMTEMQMVDSLRMYNELVERCFGECVQGFRSRKLDGKEVRLMCTPWASEFSRLLRSCAVPA